MTRGELTLQEKPADAPDRVETVDVAPGEEERMTLDERLSQVRSGGVVGSRPAASRIRECHRGGLEEDDRRTGPPSEVVRVAHPHASDRGERRVRGDSLHPELWWDRRGRI